MKLLKKYRYPWWASIAIAVFIYCTFRYLLPSLSPNHPTLEAFCRMAPDIAPVITIPFLLLGAKQLYDNNGNEENGQQERD